MTYFAILYGLGWAFALWGWWKAGEQTDEALELLDEAITRLENRRA